VSKVPAPLGVDQLNMIADGGIGLGGGAVAIGARPERAQR